MQFDYSPLLQPVTREDIEAARVAYETPLARRVKIFGGALVAVSVVPVIVMILMGEVWAGLELLLIPAFLVSLPIISRLASRGAHDYIVRRGRFVKANNLQLTESREDPDYAGMIFKTGHSRIIEQAITAPDGTEIGVYRYTVGAGRMKTNYLWTYVKVKLTRRLPHMVLDAKENNLFGRFSNLPKGFPSQKLALEGDFNNYFTLYIPKGYERDALYIITPDVMWAMIQTGKAYDMEVVDDEIYFFTKGEIDVVQQSHLDPILNMINSIGSKTLRQSRNYRDERGDRVASAQAEAAIAVEGRRLKARWSVWEIVKAVFWVVYVLGLIMIVAYTGAQ